jgi:hypothetical protein
VEGSVLGPDQQTSIQLHYKIEGPLCETGALLKRCVTERGILARSRRRIYIRKELKQKRLFLTTTKQKRVVAIIFLRIVDTLEG